MSLSTGYLNYVTVATLHIPSVSSHEHLSALTHILSLKSREHELLCMAFVLHPLYSLASLHGMHPTTRHSQTFRTKAGTTLTVRLVFLCPQLGIGPNVWI
jgi:hypothetical protein